MRALQISAFLLGLMVAYGHLESAIAGPVNPAQQALMIRRALEVRDARNAIVSRTLENVGVPYEADAMGVPVWIELAGRRMDVRAVRVSPITGGRDHEVAITTAQGTLMLREP